ncbi:MAG: hypothetical protein IJK60_03065 [Clostridia bacterium]|nr:hypothetical protein [Clostridia bacterium]
MICNNCSKELPRGSGFCPYCLYKFTEEKVIIPEPVERKNAKSVAAAVIAAVLLVVILSIAAVFFHSRNKEKAGSYAESVTNTVATTQEPETAESPETTEEPEKFEEIMVEEKPYVTDENAMTSYPPATAAVIIDESGNVRQGYILPD